MEEHDLSEIFFVNVLTDKRRKSILFCIVSHYNNEEISQKKSLRMEDLK